MRSGLGHKRASRRVPVAIVAGCVLAFGPVVPSGAATGATTSAAPVAAPVGDAQVVQAAWAGSAVLHFGDAPDAGSLAGANINKPIMGMATTPSGRGYWLVAADGGVFRFGDARFYGSEGGKWLHAPVVGMAATPTGLGYWLIAADGGIFSFGDARFHGSTGGRWLQAPVLGMAATPSGRGYWLFAGDGGIFSFGDARFHGSAGGRHLNAPVVAMAATPSGRGYWLAASDGGVFTYGDAGFHGSAGGGPLNQPVVGMAATPSGRGYWLAAADGGVFTYGDARFHGSAAGTQLNQPVIAIARSHDGGGYWMLEGQKGAQSPFTPALVASLLTRPGLVSAAVLDLNTGQMFQYKPFENITASIVKVDILQTLLYEAEAAGRGLTANEQATATNMIEFSDNNAASALYADIGGPGSMASYDQRAGLTATSPSSAWGLTTTTAVDQVTLVDHLAQPNALLTDPSRQYALNLMENVTPSQAWGVSAGVGPGAIVALKNGWLPRSSGWAINSIGYIHGTGRNYVLAALTADQPSMQTGIDTISQIAAASWSTLTS